MGVEFQVIELKKDQEFSQQVAWMRATTILVAAHGAGLVNTLFIPPGAALYEIFPPKFDYPLYRNMSQILGLDYGKECLDYSQSNASGQLQRDWSHRKTPAECSDYHCRVVHRSLKVSPSIDKLAVWLKQKLKDHETKMLAKDAG